MITLDDADGVRIITFDRPAKLNAFDTPLYLAVAGALEDARADDLVKVVVLTGRGRAFSAGQDLDEMARLATATDADAVTSGFPRFLDALGAFDKPLLAAVNGVGMGIGFTLLAHCDLVVMSQTARLRTPFAEMGVGPEAASSYLFPLRMGWQRAALVLLGGEWMTAQEAVSSGFALEAVPAEALMARTLEIAATMARSPLDALRAIKSTMLDGHAEAVAAARIREDAHFARLLAGFTRPG